jgi:hypothetical protein
MDENHQEERKPELTLDRAVKNSQAAWSKFREAQLYAFHAAVPALELARTDEGYFRVFCQDRGIKGDLPETQIAELMLQDDPDADAISRERRAEYGAAIGWFADRNLCAEVDAEKAVQLAKQKGRIKGIAALYRNHKKAENPEAVASKKRATATKEANATQATLGTSAAAHIMDTTSHTAWMPGDSKGAEVTRCGPADTTSEASEESTSPKGCVRRRTDLVEEFSRKLAEAGVVPYSPQNGSDLGVGLFLVIYDQPSGHSRMFQIVETDMNYRLLLDTIIKRHAETNTTKEGQAA